MSSFTVVLPSGRTWTPTFVTDVDHERCVGCGRCFKVCQRGVLQLRGLTEDGALVDEDDEDDEEYERKVMTIADADACVGCAACASVCGRRCFTHAEAALV